MSAFAFGESSCVWVGERRGTNFVSPSLLVKTGRRCQLLFLDPSVCLFCEASHPFPLFSVEEERKRMPERVAIRSINTPPRSITGSKQRLLSFP